MRYLSLSFFTQSKAVNVGAKIIVKPCKYYNFVVYFPSHLPIQACLYKKKLGHKYLILGPLSLLSSFMCVKYQNLHF
jgi:hypothetical protein